MTYPILLTVFALPIAAVPFIYAAGRKSAKAAALLLAAIALTTLSLILTTIPDILSSPTGSFTQSYNWIPMLGEQGTQFSLSVDGISISMAIVTMVLMLVAAIYSINYMAGKKNLPAYYALLSLLFVGLVGVFITSNLLFFYFCWELMLVPAYFIIGGWGYKDSYKTSFKFFVFTHAGAVFVLLGIGAIFMTTGSVDYLTAAKNLLTANPDIVKYILIAMTAGFAVKMAIFPVHMWLPDTYAEAPAPMSALWGGVLTSAGAYAVVRVSMGIVFPAVENTGFGNDFLMGIAIFGVISAFFGSFIALAETDLKRVIAYSSISHMGYILFGVSLIPIAATTVGGVVTQNTALTGTVLHIVTHALSKGLFFLAAGAVMQVMAIRNIKEMGGLAGKMPVTGTSSTIAALSLAGAPPFACFISEFFIFMGAFQVIQSAGPLANFFIIPTALMLVATVFSLAYALRFTTQVFLGPSKNPLVVEKKKLEVPRYMQVAMVILVVLVIVVGVYPSFFVNLINTAAGLI
jgi:NADH-quinone oxidoreductase subunit M